MLFIKSFDSNCLKNYIMNQFHEEVNNIGNNNNFIIYYDTDYKSHDDLSSYFINKYSAHPKYILFLWDLDQELCIKIRKYLSDTKIIVWTDDLHWFNIKTYNNNYFTYSNADLILSHYNNYKDFYQLDINHKVYQFYHSCSPIFIRDNINLESINEVYIYGAMNEHYKYRTEFYDNINKFFPNKFYYRPHPGYQGDQSHITKITSDELYKYSFGFTAAIYPIFEIKEKPNSKYYLIGKFFEIPGSGALLLCNHYGVKDEMESLGFQNFVNYIHIDNDNFIEIMNYLFDQTNKEEILKIRYNGHQLVKNNHQIKNRMDNINSFLSKYIN